MVRERDWAITFSYDWVVERTEESLGPFGLHSIPSAKKKGGKAFRNKCKYKKARRVQSKIYITNATELNEIPKSMLIVDVIPPTALILDEPTALM